MKHWTTSDGRVIPINELDHQHLSNIIWFIEVFYGPKSVPLQLSMRLVNMFNGERLPWKPLPIEGEIAQIKKLLKIDEWGNIYGSTEMPKWNGKIIGGIYHIENWKNL